MTQRHNTGEPAVIDGGLTRLRFDVAYDGTDFSGWARQIGQRTVQEVLEEHLATVLRAPVRLTVAGRTDAGVHASAQVAHADVPVAVVPADPSRLVRRLGRFLPADVRVLAVRPVSAEFDARFSALRRHYRYRITTAPWGAMPLAARAVAPHSRPLDVDRLNAASARLEGLHDFAAFCRRREGATTIRELQSFTWTADGDAFDARLTADAFCWSMVRSLVGAVLAVGDGRREPEWMDQLLAQRERTADILVAPAHGLELTGVDYPPKSELAARNARTRDVRGAHEVDSTDIGCAPRPTVDE